MNTAPTTEWACDRCGTKTTMPVDVRAAEPAIKPPGWATVTVPQPVGVAGRFDLCLNCIRALREWIAPLETTSAD